MFDFDEDIRLFIHSILGSKKRDSVIDIVEDYGGQMIFTPGDVVYSSTKFLNLSIPKIQLEKLLILMQNNDISFESLRDTVSQLSNYHVHVVGDTIVDSYTRSTFIGGQIKTPTVSVLYQGHDDYIGGAGIVAQHIRASGAKVTFSTILGDDTLKDFVISGLKDTGVNILPIIDPSRPTTQKNAIISGGYRLLKIDKLDNRPISDDILEKLIEMVKQTSGSAVVFSDYRHGIFNKRSIITTYFHY